MVSTSQSTIIGKDVIESLTMGMYDDSKFIYREYIQNSADQIDKAESDGLLSRGEGEIHINIDELKKIIVIDDNATGIKQSDVLPVLRNIAQSTKRRGIDKGFRGIGRLGGLGYCSQLVFETSFKGEAIKSTLVWDAELLKQIINNRETKEEASDVIEQVTSFSVSQENIDAHYFRVTLIGVTNAVLLSTKEVRNYLSMVAPTPFENHFFFKTKIYDELKNEGLSIDEYKIFINAEQVFKAYSANIYEGEEGNKKIEEELK